MNTREINGSAWPIKYYVIAAVPLTMLTLLVPLFALRAFNFLVRFFQTNALFRGVIKWALLSSAFMVKVVADALNYLPSSNLPIKPSAAPLTIVYIFLLAVFAAPALLYLHHLLPQGKNPLRKEWWRTLYSEHQLWPLFFVVAFMMVILGMFHPIIGFVPYILYVFICIRRYMSRRKNRKT